MRTCHACGLTPTPRGGRCAECEKKRRKAWKQAARAKKQGQGGAKPAKTTPAMPKPARKPHSASVASAELLPGVEMVLRRVYERVGEAERAELRVLNPDIDFEKG